MKYQKEVLRALISKSRKLFSSSKSVLCLLSLGLMFNLACSHKFIKLENKNNAKITNQTLCIKIYTGDDVEKFTVYAQSDRENKRATLDGVGKFDKYVFHMEINKNNIYSIKIKE